MQISFLHVQTVFDHQRNYHSLTEKPKMQIFSIERVATLATCTSAFIHTQLVPDPCSRDLGTRLWTPCNAFDWRETGFADRAALLSVITETDEFVTVFGVVELEGVVNVFSELCDCGVQSCNVETASYPDCILWIVRVFLSFGIPGNDKILIYNFYYWLKRIAYGFQILS